MSAWIAGDHGTEEATVGQKVNDTTWISASPDVVWTVITELSTYPEWAGNVRRTEVLVANDDGSPHQARFTVDARVAEINYVIEYRYVDYDITWHLIEGDTISQLNGEYRLYETEDGGTEVHYALEVDIDLPVPGFLKKRAARSILEQGLSGLKSQAEAQA